MSTNTLDDMLSDWGNEELEMEDDNIGNDNSSYIVGYGEFAVKTTMAKLIEFKGKKSKWIEIDFETQDGKNLRERFMVLGKDSKPFYLDKRTKQKKAHIGYNKIRSLLKVAGIQQDAKDSVKAVFQSGEVADVTYTEWGKEKTESFTVFPDLIGVKTTILVSSKKLNTQSAFDDSDEYLVFCQKETEKFKKAHPKKKSLLKFKKTDEYQNVFRWITESSVQHFVSPDGLLQSEMGGEGGLKDKWLSMNDTGVIFDMRSLIIEDLTESQRKKYSLNEYGKIEENDSDESFDEPEETEEPSDSDDEW